MTFTYFKLASDSDLGCSARRGMPVNLLALRRRSARQRRDGDGWLGLAMADGASVWAPGVARASNASYILQQAPDGCWYLDQWKQDAAAAIRPIAANQDGASAPAADEAELYFIIEIN
jgi:hypothetical protein